MNGAIMIVAKRSRRLSIVRVAIMPGIAHAKLLISGRKAFPCKPDTGHQLIQQKCRPGHVTRIFQAAR